MDDIDKASEEFCLAVALMPHPLDKELDEQVFNNPKIKAYHEAMVLENLYRKSPFVRK